MLGKEILALVANGEMSAGEAAEMGDLRGHAAGELTYVIELVGNDWEYDKSTDEKNEILKLAETPHLIEVDEAVNDAVNAEAEIRGIPDYVAQAIARIYPHDSQLAQKRVQTIAEARDRRRMSTQAIGLTKFKYGLDVKNPAVEAVVRQRGRKQALERDIPLFFADAISQYFIDDACLRQETIRLQAALLALQKIRLAEVEPLAA
jgi:chorismate mutase